MQCNKKPRLARAGLAALAILALTATSLFAADPGAARTTPRDATLIVYTFRTPGVCPACDAARPIAIRAARDYPMEFVYRDDPRGAARCMAAGVDRFPTFILETTGPDGAPREALRWSGSTDLARKIRAAFRALR